jgi:hypothetical protein
MRTTRNDLAIMCLVASVVCLGAGPLGAQGFRDEFVNPDPSNPDREPVSWANEPGNTTNLAIGDGNLFLRNDSLRLATAFVDPADFAAENVAVESQFRLLEGTNVGLFVQTTTGDCFFGHVAASTHPFGPMLAGLIDCRIGNFIEQDSARAQVIFDVLEKDVVMRVEAIGNVLRMWVWPADEQRPDAPTALATTDRVPGRAMGLLVDDVDRNGPAAAVFRYYEATVIPEPSTAVTAGIGLLGLVAWRRRKPWAD